ncbi:substrate-binding domain-containing protein [Sulfobacillus harzensis]|uniref:Substrate-binding domain-containing protein n=1 Tax=Sulfobacillus harzensis TaxID=2729629 RepID=A0A7Y0L5C7_9FIRM|nr:GntR family transcriptional regulator [Sulfobacillus harzensis]NMP22755.1 substrate-binding domain-containing protein [Sulfobacillus harzensis]
MVAKQRMYRTIYEDMKKYIIQGAWPKGSQVPPEHVLMAKYHVSRVTTSHALKLLTDEGLITRHPGTGSFVAGAAPESSEKSIALADPVSIPAVGFVLPSLDQSFGPPMLSPLESTLQEQGLTLALACSHGSQEQEEEAISRLWALGVKGIIVLPVNGQFYNREILRLHLAQFPLVLVDKSLPGVAVPCVSTDNRLAAAELTRHLLELGHKKIVFYSPDPFQTSTLRDRFLGYQDALEAYHIAEVSLFQPIQGSSKAEAVQRVTEYLQDHPDVTGVFAADDELADHWVAALQALGKQLGKDVSLVTFDAYLTDNTPTLTTMVQDQARIIQEAFKILASQWDDTSESITSVSVPATLSVGGSTGTNRNEY